MPDPQQGVTFDSQPTQAPQAAPNASGNGVTFDSQPISDQQSSSTPSDSDEGILGKTADFVGNSIVGAGKGLLKTVSGADDFARKHLPAFMTNTGMGFGKPEDIQAVKDAAVPHGIAQNLGYGGETLTEFMLGDEALKGLSMADRLTTVAKWMKIAEKSPRLMQALKFGATAAKADTELTPEEAALVKQYPKLAKLVGIGIDAARAGATQGVQTTARTGSVKEGAKDALGTAATGAAFGGVTGAASSVIGKGSKAAQTIAEMGDTAAGAPTRAAVEEGLGNTVREAFTNETGTLQNNLDDATSQIGMFGEGAPQQSAITAAAQKYAKEGEQAVHDAYQGRLDDLAEMSEGSTVPYEGSPLHTAAQELTTSTPETAGPLDQAFNIAQPASPRANAILDRLKNLGAEGEEGGPQPEKWVDANGVEHTEPAAPGEDTPPTDLTMQHLVARRQTLSRIVRDLSPTDPNYQADKKVYSRLLDGIDDTIGQLADGITDHPLEEGEASQGRQLFDQMNAAYRDGIRPFQNKDVKNILSGKLNDVSKSIMGGQTSIKDIADVKQALGPQNFAKVSQASLQNIVQSFMDDSGELDYKKLFSKFNKMDPDVRTAMFGDQGKSLSQALKVATDSASGLTDIGKQINDLLGNGNIDSILKDPKQAQAIANVVGPDGMKTIGQSILQNKIAEASTTLNPKTGQIEPSHFDPDKVLNWWMSMKDSPEVRNAFFTVDKDTSKQYNELMSNLAQASSVKKLVK